MYKIMCEGEQIGSDFESYTLALSTALHYCTHPTPYEGIVVVVQIFENNYTLPLARIEDGELCYHAAYFG